MTIDCSKLVPGQICVTRDGGEAQYVGKITCAPDEDDIGRAYVFYHDSCDETYQHYQCGWIGGVQEDEDDIISIKKPKRVLDCWVNVYEDGAGFFFRSLEQANDCVIGKRIACLHIVQEYEEGEGLNE